MGLLTALLSTVGLVVAVAVRAPTATPEHGVWPMRPPLVVRGFEPPSSAWSAGHRGVDVEGSAGAPVFASLGGTVTFAADLAGRGVIVISHGDTRTTYEPVLAEVRASDLVLPGERIGTLEMTQSHCLPAACLHWGWLRGSEYLDPLQLIGSAHKVRLLPLRLAGAPAGRRS